MKNVILTSVLLLSIAWPGLAQNKNLLDPKDLSITWEIIKSSHHTGGETFSLLSIKNNSKVTLPASGWSIFFNIGFLKTAGPDSSIALVKQVNGDLFSLVPLKGFKALKSGETCQIRMSSSEINKITEFPNGFYLVWDNNPSRGYNLTQVFLKPKPGQYQFEQNLAEQVYRQNKVITDIPTDQLPAIFPTPISYVKQQGTFKLTSDVKLVTQGAFEKEATLFANELLPLLGKKPQLVTETGGRNIVFQKDETIAAESYTLSVLPERILIRAAQPSGAFYAIQSLKTMFPPQAWASAQKEIIIQAAEVKDGPRFGHRSFMMDVGRNFQPKKEVLKVLDVMALYKLNVLHFHLNDDEGWRIEIPGLPELTEIGSKRGHTADERQNILPSYGSGADVNVNSGSGFYTKADYVEILKYATERHIKVIPEIETPGHARAAIKSMDARYERLMKEGKKTEAERYLLRDLNDRSTYRSVQGWNDNVINVALPSVYNFLEKVTDELIAMHKEAGASLETIHFGGDEVPAGVWEHSPVVSNLLQSDPAIQGVDELWYYYFNKLNQLMKSRNIYISGWEEIGLRKAEINGQKSMVLDPRFVNENFHADVWNNLNGSEDLAYKMANAGYKVVLTCVTNFYIDLAANKSFEEIGQYWGGFVDIDKLFYFIPYNYYKNVKEDVRGNTFDKSILQGKERLTEFGKSNIVGLQAPLWSEKLKTPQQFEYMLFPKLLGLSERAWAKDPEWANENDNTKEKALYNKAWSEFVNVIGKKELPRLNHYSGGFDYRIPTPGATLINGNLEVNIQYPGLTIRYTLDGSEPDKDSPVYQGPINIKGKDIRLRAFDAKGRAGRSILIKTKLSDNQV